MKNVIIITTILAFGLSLSAQNIIDTVLATVERNNTTLSAYRKSTDAEKIGNKTGLAIPNPEVEFGYLIGNPSAIGNRTDFSITQSFDFPTAYAYKKQISNLKNEQSELEYKKQRIDILYQTRQLCIRLTYHNAFKIELEKRYVNAQRVANAYKEKFEKGDIGILEYNKAQIDLLSISKKLENNEIERYAHLSKLTTLNGGYTINFTDSIFPLLTIPEDFEQWYAQAETNNPLLQWLKQEIAIASKEEKLNTAMSFPKFTAGYMNENADDEKFQGVTLGVTIPLWENKNTVKYAKAYTIAMHSLERDNKLQFYNNMKSLHAKIIAMQKNVNDYRSKLALFSNSELLKQAFNKGKISLSEYIYELSLYYNSISTLLEMEMDLLIACAELNRYQ